MRLIHMYAGDDGQTHFRDYDLRLAADPRESQVLEISGVQGARLQRTNAPNMVSAFHTEPRRQLVLYLTGSREMTSGNGESRVIGSGDILLADDTTGQGHRSRSITDSQQGVLIYIDPALSIDSIFSAAVSPPTSPGQSSGTDVGSEGVPMRFVVMYTGEDSQTHFKDLDVDFPEKTDTSQFLELAGVQGARLSVSPPKGEADFHNAPRRMIIMYLSGSREIIGGNGESQVVGPGVIFLTDDTTGQGHRCRGISDPQQRIQLYVDPDLSIESIFSGG